MAVSSATQSAAEAWKARIEAHNEQTVRTRGDLVYEDMWSTLAQRFKDDPRRNDDPVVNDLAAWLTPESTVLDVGGGAGRYALPLALRAKHVTVVEPSPSMLEALRQSALDAGIENVSAVEGSWEEADVAAHDVVLCANVVYGVAEIGEFVGKLAEAARDRVAIVLYMDAPLSRMSPIWTEVHGEERIDMPGLPELLPVLWELGILSRRRDAAACYWHEDATELGNGNRYGPPLPLHRGREREGAAPAGDRAPLRGRDAGGSNDARGERAAAGDRVVGERRGPRRALIFPKTVFRLGA
jgi:SAM-dependent methyltransferase